MSNSTNEARQLAAVFKNAAKDGLLEKPFRDPVEAHLIQVARSAGIELVPHTEVTMGTSGRADTIYNRFIVEWKQPGLFSASNNATANSKAIAQLKGYVETFWFSNRQKPGRVVGCCTDGRYFIFATKPAHEWHVSDPVPIDEQTCRKFLDYFFSLHSGIALLSEYLAEDFSAENVRTQRTVKALYQSLEKHAHSPSLEAIFDQWAQFFGAVTEYEQWRVKLANEAELRKTVKAFGIPQDKLDLNRFFFATHTFFAILTKLLAYVIVGRYTDLPTPPLEEWKNLTNDKLAEHFAALEKGGPFHAAGIRNFLEGDFFAWYVKYFTPELATCLKAVVERLADYDPATLDLAPGPTQDMLKKLYHRLVSAHIRKALGEFYTPDWLAQRLLNMLDGGRFQGDPQKRLLDPTCGSGTILVQTINAIRTNSIAQSMDQGELLRTICQNVVGIDLNPLAVIAARTNYLLALGPLLKFRGTEPLEIPIYLADSVMTPSRGDTHDLFETDKVRVWLSIGKVELPLRLASQRGVAALTHLLDEHLEKTPSTPSGKFTGLAEKRLKESYSASKLKEQGLTPDEAWKKDETTIAALYARLHELHAAGRNGLWARIIKNAFAPVFLAPFDYVAGNPPWIGWENLPEGYRNESKELWQRHGLFVHSGMDTILGKGKKDISMLVTYVAADSYLKDGGKLGFVITQAVFKMAGAAQGFRRFKTRRGIPLNCFFVDDFSELQLFEGATNKTAVFVMRKGEPQKYPLRYTYWLKKEAGRKGSFDYDATLEEVTSKTERKDWVAEPADDADQTSAWLTGNKWVVKTVKKVLGKSAYHAHLGVNAGGGSAVYYFELLGKPDGDGIVMARNLVENAKRKIESVQTELEMKFLHPLLKGQDVDTWNAKPSAHLLFVQDVQTRRGLAHDKLEGTQVLKWLELHEKMLRQRAAYKRYYKPDRDPFWSMFDVGDYTVAPWKVVWSRIAWKLEAAVVSKVKGQLVLPQETFSFVGLQDETEAYFVCGVVNSTPFRFAVSCFSQSGSKSFGTPSILEKARIPKFDPSSKLHQAIATEARRLSSGAADATEPVNTQLDSLCKDLWGVSEQELKNIEAAYRELYVSAPKESSGSELKEDAPEYKAEEGD
jgi:hypothetical protein